MSRIADAVARSGMPDGFVRPLAPGDLDAAADLQPPVQWNFDADAAGSREAAVVTRAVPAPGNSDGPTHAPDPDLIELVQRVFRPGGPPVARVLTIAAVGHAAAPHALTLSIARTLASYNAGTVCVVDASGGAAGPNPHAGALSAGLADMLCGNGVPASAAVPLEHGLWHVPAGTTAWPRHWPQAMPRAVAALADAFDFVIVHAPAVDGPAGVGAFLALASATDGAVVTVDMRQTRRDIAAEVLSRVRESGVEVFGAVTVHGGRRRSHAGRRGVSV